MKQRLINLSQSVVTEDVIDVYQTLGLEQPDLSILSDDFLKDVQGLKQKNVAVELLNRLLKGQVKSLMKTNATVSKRFSEMLGIRLINTTVDPLKHLK